MRHYDHICPVCSALDNNKKISNLTGSLQQTCFVKTSFKGHCCRHFHGQWKSPPAKRCHIKVCQLQSPPPSIKARNAFIVMCKRQIFYISLILLQKGAQARCNLHLFLKYCLQILTQIIPKGLSKRMKCYIATK